MSVPPLTCCFSLLCESRWARHFGMVTLLLGIGYLAGSQQLLNLTPASAQPPNPLDGDAEQIQIDLSNEAFKQLQTTHETLVSAMELLRSEGQYRPATATMNPYLILGGGGDAIDDLERGMGVDPLTYADLYAGNAVQEIEDELSRDEQGRLLYKNKLVRMYSVDRLKQQQERVRAVLEKRLLP